MSEEQVVIRKYSDGLNRTGSLDKIPAFSAM